MSTGVSPIAGVPGELADYRQEHPSRPVLVVEVSESSLRFDRRSKGGLYARAGIPDYWIVNVEKRFLEVYRDPRPDASADFGFSYGDVKYYEKDDEIEALALPGVKIRVADILL
jgi:Uma2 family endonuclease